jgi:hypothetical protein
MVPTIYTQSHASSATYKYVGKPFASVSGCLSKSDHISMTVVLKSPIKEGDCFSGTPVSTTISDGVNALKAKSANTSGVVGLCKLSPGSNKISDYDVAFTINSASSGDALTFVDLTNSPVSDAVADFDGKCAPESNGSTGAAGKWTGP